MNKNSFGEMNKDAVENYIHHVQRCCKKYFFHMNHEKESSTGSIDRGLINSEYPINKDLFKKLYRMYDIGHFIFHH